MENNGRYGNIFELSYQGKFISYDNSFHWKGEVISEELKEEIKSFGKELQKHGNRLIKFRFSKLRIRFNALLRKPAYYLQQ